MRGLAPTSTFKLVANRMGKDKGRVLLPQTWKPVHAKNLRRVGPDEDGGYVVSSSALSQSDLLLSMGLNHDWRFEEAFQQQSGARVICYDGSVDRRFWQIFILKKLLRFKPFEALHYLSYKKFFSSGKSEHRKMMVGYDAEGSVSLSSALGEVGSDHVFLKVDIEGWEYRILDQIVQNRNRLTGVVMELHDIDLHRDRIGRFIQGMNDFEIVHLTPNNFGGVDATGDPVVVEISLMRNALVERATNPVEATVMPHFPNTTDRPDIMLRFEQ